MFIYSLISCGILHVEKRESAKMRTVFIYDHQEASFYIKCIDDRDPFYSFSRNDVDVLFHN